MTLLSGLQQGDLSTGALDQANSRRPSEESRISRSLANGDISASLEPSGLATMNDAFVPDSNAARLSQDGSERISSAPTGWCAWPRSAR